jgi:hypothetical protein
MRHFADARGLKIDDRKNNSIAYLQLSSSAKNKTDQIKV